MRFIKSLAVFAALVLSALVAAPASAQTDTTAVSLTRYADDLSCLYSATLTLDNVDSTAHYATQAFNLANADLTAPLFYQIDLGTADTVSVILEVSHDRSTWSTVTTTNDIVADTWYASTANGVKAARFGGFQVGAGTGADGTSGTVTLNVKVPIRQGATEECWTINSSR